MNLIEKKLINIFLGVLVIIVTVVLSLPVRQCFKYFMPDVMKPVIGGRIIVPFRSKDIVGIVISFYKKFDISQLNFKFIKSIIDTESLYTDISINILIWLSKNYHCPIGSLFFSVLPKFLSNNLIIKKKHIYQWIITHKGREIDLNLFRKSKKQFYTLVLLRKNNILSSELKQYDLSKTILKKLESKELCKVTIASETNVFKKYIFKIKRKIFLNDKILYILKKILIKNCFSCWLLTKTNLYLKVKFYLGLIRETLKKDMQILILVPYIKDINKIVLFLNKFFNSVVDIIHSKLTNTQYLSNWIRIKNGKNSIVVGTKKSIFLPFLKLGLIIIDQEHSLNYKSINKCRYNIRDIGILRAYKEKIPIILDSDSPSLKTLHNILCKKCCCIKIHSHDYFLQFNHDIIDLKKEKVQVGLSLTLINEMHRNLKKKYHVLLIFNKFNISFLTLMCNICGWTAACSTCHDHYEVNSYYNTLSCRFCLIKIQKPLFCCNCKCSSLVTFDMGVEKIKNKIQNIFPNIPLIFLLNNKNISNKKLLECSIKSSCIIVATEKIVQSYYFPYVRLISLISIDYCFFSFQFRSIEYFAQLYVNLNKLTGYSRKTLKVLIQTSFPYDSYLKELCCNGYFSFANKTLLIRKKFLLPPWSFQAIFYSESVNPEKNFYFLNFMRTILKRKSKNYNFFIWFSDPYPSFFLNNRNNNSYQLLIQCSSRAYLNNLLNESIDVINLFSISKTVTWFIDIDPY